MVYDYICDNDRASNRVLARLNEGHFHARMAINYGLDLLRVDLLATDVNDPVRSADEIITVAAQLHHVAGIDKAGFVGEGTCITEVTNRGPGRSDAERAVFELHLHFGARLSDQGRRETSETVADSEGDAGLCRSEGMGDCCLRVNGPQVVQNCLVRDFSRQPNVARRNSASHWAHKGASPMGRSSGDMCHTACAGSRQKVPCRLLRAGQHHRPPAEDRAKKDL